jgi:hypothetical protein
MELISDCGDLVELPVGIVRSCDFVVGVIKLLIPQSRLLNHRTLEIQQELL